MTMSSRPNSAPISAATEPIRAPSVTSADFTKAPGPIRRAVSCNASARRPVSTNVAPSSASAMLAAWPIPLPAPVTHATLPVKRPITATRRSP